MQVRINLNNIKVTKFQNEIILHKKKTKKANG